ncbi:SGNH/GDSL hydrolase family protein [Parasphingorhabdus litoris]|nr:SGNH/GDSL hydrolase family protein [Parasphingorhabdus litoris]
MKARFLGAIAGGLMLATAVPAHAERDTEKFTSLTIFGDSLVDAGNVFTASGGMFASPADGYFNGRFTNGYDYTDLLSIELFGAPTVASLQGGTNFAFGGARASNTNIFVPDLGEQLGLYAGYLADPANEVDRNGLYILNFGGNDIFNAPDDPVDADLFIRQSARDYAAGIQALNDIGARNLLLTGFPVADPLSLNAELYLTQELAALSLTSDTTLFRYSYLDFFNRLATDPGSFGLPPQRLDITCQLAGPAAIANGCEGIFSFDGVHPTAPIHRALFQDISSQFNLLGSVPEPTTWAMMIFGFFMTGSAIRRRQKIKVSYG